MNDNAKEFIIKNLRQSLIDKNQLTNVGCGPNASYFKLQHSDDLVINFTKSFMLMGGNLAYCVSIEDFAQTLDKWILTNKLEDVHCCSQELSTYVQSLGLSANKFSVIGADLCNYGLVTCDALIAWNGSILISGENFENKVINMPENSVLIAFSSQVVHDWKAYQKQLEDNGKSVPDEIFCLKPNALIDRKIQLILIEDQNL